MGTTMKKILDPLGILGSGGLFGPSKSDIPSPAPAPAVPSSDDASVVEAASQEAERLRKKRGAASSIATGPQGLQEPATTYKKTLGD